MGPHELRVGDAASQGFILCGKCGLPFTVKGLGAHSRSCGEHRPSRPLASIASVSDGDGGVFHGSPAEPYLSLISRNLHAEGSSQGEERASQCFLPPLIAAGRRSSMMSPASQPGSSTPGSAATQALQAMMRNSVGGEDKWLMDEIANFNVPVKRRKFPKEASKSLREALDETLSLALSLHHSSPLAFSAYSSSSSSRGCSSALYRMAAMGASRRQHC